MTRDEHISRELERLFREWSVRTAPIGALIFLLIAPLDFISAPGLAVRFLLYRVAAAAGLLLVWRMAARARSPRALRAWLLAGVAIGAAAIELMILAHGGCRSPYIDGMILLAVTVLGFIPASAGFHLLLAGTIYAHLPRAAAALGRGVRPPDLLHPELPLRRHPRGDGPHAPPAPRLAEARDRPRLRPRRQGARSSRSRSPSAPPNSSTPPGSGGPRSTRWTT